ncbi:CPBP family glutamic-type intramembrane protease [Oscillatoria sp. CS-180]|uniref:CPBP family glutamic-type intramembrane protease n=1 Tax=Oscillatoria sp. CS-180 TaxID=3021720 RepID=UPI00233131FF|nr:CPBP family glutamic-type intramembrane protease [Oscillatoria sp. CS-180]MDB9527960.1 CPBP family glutamic-type intramembrane protease [Oscillatoria sp. CS-180]
MVNWLKPKRILWFLAGLGLLLGLAIHLLLPKPPPAPQASSYEKIQIAAFSRSSNYLTLTNASFAGDDWYRPIAEWTGRLILPTEADYEQATGDWVWLEIQNAPQPDLIGQTVKLTWQQTPAIQQYLAAVTVDVNMGEAAARSRLKGDVVPNRLDGRRQVGPLQSLAGALPMDEVVVRLSEVEQQADDPMTLAIRSVPVQISGRLMALVQILESVPRSPRSLTCPGQQPCPSESFRVRHYNPATQQFDGLETVIRIPQQPRDRNDRLMSSILDLEESPAGNAGWYVYGAFDTEGVFTAEALQPRSLMQLTADEVVLGTTPASNFITWQNWRDIEDQQGTLDRTIVVADPGEALDESITEESIAAASAVVDQWQLGDRGLLMHLFGGIGGDRAEGGVPGTVTGHFSFGLWEIVRDRFTNEPQFQITYHQVYGHNPNGIVSGVIDWSAYTGDLEKGWLGSRPISDVAVKLDILTDALDVGSRSLLPLDTLLTEIQIIAARYRTGDGTGVTPVTPATSCVQDSGQALYIAIEQLKQQATATPALTVQSDISPDIPDAENFQELVKLGRSLENLLVPYGVVRSDWKQNAKALAGVNRRDQFVSSQNFINVLLSWRSMLPRRAHDDLSQVFLKHGAQLWFFRTNQVGGRNPEIVPLAPTELFGRSPVFGTLIKRLSDAVSASINSRVGLITAGALSIYGAIAVLYGFRSGFLELTPTSLREWLRPSLLLRLLIMPAILEEILFRVFLLPHPLEGVAPLRWLLWACLSLFLFLVYHPLNALLFYPPGRKTFWDGRFLSLTLLLGITCTVVYGLTGAFWAIVLIHWSVVIVWLKGLGGEQQLLTVTETDDK